MKHRFALAFATALILVLGRVDFRSASPNSGIQRLPIDAHVEHVKKHHKHKHHHHNTNRA